MTHLTNRPALKVKFALLPLRMHVLAFPCNALKRGGATLTFRAGLSVRCVIECRFYLPFKGHFITQALIHSENYRKHLKWISQLGERTVLYQARCRLNVSGSLKWMAKYCHENTWSIWVQHRDRFIFVFIVALLFFSEGMIFASRWSRNI